MKEISRRNFIKGAAASALSVAALGKLGGFGKLLGQNVGGGPEAEVGVRLVKRGWTSIDGFVGTAVVVLLYVALLIRIIILAERQRSTFSRVYGYAIAGILFVHVAINIGMTIGLVPVIGIPLPFLSYGGSSMLAFTIMLAIFVKQDANRLNIL